MSDLIFNIYHNVESSKELWDSLESKYMVDDASSKKFFNLKIDESIYVSSVIDKSLHSWKDLKHSLKHGKDDLLLVQLGNHLRIEKSLRTQESDKGKGKEVAQSLVLAQWNAVYDANNEVDCLMLGSITLELHGQLENSSPYEMLHELKSMFEKQAGVESVGLIMNGLTSDFAGFAATPLVMAIQGSRIEKANKKSLNAKGKDNKDTLIRSRREFKDYLKACGIVQLLTPPYTPQHNGDYALESAARILNMVLTEKVDKTPYDLWYGKVPDLSYLKVCGCEALVKRDTPDKLQQRSVKCILIGYPKETTGYYFYFSPKNKIVVVRYAEFLEKNLISQEVSRRAVELEKIQDEDTSPSEITSEISMEVEAFEPPQEEVILIRRSERTHQAPELLYPESNKWLDTINAEMQSMKDNQVRRLVDLPPNYKTVKSFFVDPKHPRKVCKLQRSIYGLKKASSSWNKRFDEEIKRFGFAQNLDEPCIYQKASGSNVTFLILYVDDIIIMGNHISSLQSVKDYLGKCFAMKDLGETSFILRIKIYRDSSKRLIGLNQCAYMDKILKRYKTDNSKHGHIYMQERLDLNKTQGDSTPEEVKHMKNVPYASAKGSIMYTTRCTRPDVAFVQNITSRFQQNPDECHWTAVKNILKYLRNNKDMFLVYGENLESKLRVDCYCNVGFETDIDDMKSQTGYVFILNGKRKSRDARFDENRFSSIPKPKDVILNPDEYKRDDRSNDVSSETPIPHKEAIDAEIGSIMEDNTWVLSNLPPGIVITQSRYIEKILKKFNPEDCSLSTQHDIDDAIGRLSRLTTNRSRQHWHTITKVFKYLKGTMNHGLCYSRHPSILKAYTDASWINHAEDSSSTSEWVFLLGGGAISWSSKKHTCISQSTIEYEFVALVAVGKEAKWL
nr:retrotransposon protein, putative, Ty1-copia subclass [Tanacetum cinerariifolium]